ncbi:nucleotidyltransferase substrate binding protein [Salicola sp. Rm-C-2C1-2]|uniref:nucleotidyltransferase substrate binding protein n=1 Tax=Salicola sp. Rm-C-2C1-2 TaxID=3141321 RepID=UPI0032E3A991
MSNEQTDVRWLQRLTNFRKALARLNDAVETAQARALSELEKQGVIQAFEYTYELSWKLLLNGLDHTMSLEAQRHGFSG